MEHVLCASSLTCTDPLDNLEVMGLRQVSHNSNKNGLVRLEFGSIFLMTFYFLYIFFNLKDIVTRHL